MDARYSLCWSMYMYTSIPFEEIHTTFPSCWAAPACIMIWLYFFYTPTLVLLYVGKEDQNLLGLRRFGEGINLLLLLQNARFYSTSLHRTCQKWASMRLQNSAKEMTGFFFSWGREVINVKQEYDWESILGEGSPYLHCVLGFRWRVAYSFNARY